MPTLENKLPLIDVDSAYMAWIDAPLVLRKATP